MNAEVGWVRERGERRGIPHFVRNDADGLALIFLKKPINQSEEGVLCIGALTAPNTKENHVNNLSELLNYFNEPLEQTGNSKELTVSAAKLCDLLVEVELMLKTIRRPRA